MAFFETNKDIPDETNGILYILVLEIGEHTVYKVGVTQRQIQDRVGEILTSFWHQYRFYPYCKPKRFTKTTNVWQKEAMMHRYLEDYKYESEHKFSGCQELFVGIEIEPLLEVYARCLDGEDICSIK